MSLFKKIILIVCIIIISAFSGIFADRYFFPYLSSTELFSQCNFLKKSTEDVTVINKTEQVYVGEESSINKITSQVSSAIVNIISHVDTSSEFKNGTGEIVTSDGIIMTHKSALIIPGKYIVSTFDGNSYEASLLGIDSWSDLAFLKINASNLPVISFANSDDYAAGEKVIAIGNDLSEYQNIFNSGIINAFSPFFSISGQALSTAEKLEGVFLTDFKAERLSPGGPIIDYSGQVLGVTGMVKKNDKNEYFEIPANKIKRVLEKVIAGNLKTNPTLGAYYISLNKSYSSIHNLSVNQGALIFSPSGQNGLAIVSGSSAQKSGLKINDIILKVDEKEISSKNNLSDILYSYKKGDSPELTVLRNNQEIQIKVQL